MMAQNANPKPKLTRNLALTLLYVGGWLAVSTAAALLILPGWTSPSVVLAYGIEALGVLFAILGALLLVVTSIRRPPEPTSAPGWDTLFAAQQRLAAYARDAAAHAMAVPFILVTTGALVFIVVTRVLTRSTTDDYQSLVFAAGYIAMTVGSLVPFVGLMREARRLHEDAKNAPLDTSSEDA